MVTPATKKPHPEDQRCGTCAYMRPRSPILGGQECRWDGPPWTERAVALSDLCRRWAMRPAPKTQPKPAPPHDPESTTHA